MSQEEIVFVDGLFVNQPRDGAPDFVKGSLSLHVDRLKNFLNDWYDPDNDYINLDIMVARSGKWYAKINTYERDNSDSKKSNRPSQKQSTTAGRTTGNFDDDIPF